MLLLLLALQCPDGSPPPCARAAPRPAAPATGVAILPFVSRSSDSSDAYLAEALPEQIAGRLARIGELQVRSATNVAAQWRRTPDPAQAARALRVEWYVTGSIRRVGRMISVNAELVRASTGNGVWSAPFRHSQGDIAAIEEQIAESVAVGVAGQLAPDDRRALRSRPARNAEAYRLYLLGSSLMKRRTTADIQRAVTAFDGAVRLDPRFAEAWARLGYARTLQIQWGNEDGLRGDSLARIARASIARALALDSGVAEAWQALGSYKTVTQDRDLESTQAAIRRALTLDSTKADSWHALAYIYGANQLALPEIAERYARRALALDPDLRNTWRLMSDIRVMQGRYQEALAFADSALARGTWAHGHFLRSAVRWTLGDARGALEDLDQATRVEGLPATVRGEIAPRRAIFQMSLGDSTALKALLEEAQRLTAAGRPQYVDLALFNMLLGRTDEALNALELLRGIQLNEPMCGELPCSVSLRTWRVMHNPVFAPLRNDPRFRRLLEETRPRLSWQP